MLSRVRPAVSILSVLTLLVAVGTLMPGAEEAAAAAGAAGAAATTPGAAEAGAKAHKALSLLDLIIAGGPIEYALLVMSMITYSLALQWTFTIKADTLITPGLADDVHAAFADGVTDEAVEKAREIVEPDISLLGMALKGALDKKDIGYTAMREAAEIAGAAEHNRLITKVSWLSLFSSSATLGGLLGTVSGIIGSFLKMAANPGGVDPSQLAENIGEALVCTATGLIIAIGGLMFFFMLRGRVNQAAMDSAVLTSEILDYFRPQEAQAH